MINKTCTRCEKPITIWPYEEKKKNYCSHKCANTDRRAKKETRECEYCKSKFTILEYRQDRYCSQSCVRKNWENIAGGENSVHWKGGKPKCKTCGVDIDSRATYCWDCVKRPSGENHHNWKGDKVSYSGIHEWIKRKKNKLEYCEVCGSEEHVDIANISGEYKREVSDWRYMCKKCHHIHDNIYEKAWNTKRKLRGATA